ncbi:hypothetical protein LINPERPRIM_LOCUS22233, partial [Linum perenne]
PRPYTRRRSHLLPPLLLVTAEIPSLNSKICYSSLLMFML